MRTQAHIRGLRAVTDFNQNWNYRQILLKTPQYRILWQSFSGFRLVKYRRMDRDGGVNRRTFAAFHSRSPEVMGEIFQD